MKAGDKVNGTCNPHYSYIQICPVNVALYSVGATLFTMKVDKYDNIRLSSWILNKAGISGKTLKVRIDNGTIVVG